MPSIRTVMLAAVLAVIAPLAAAQTPTKAPVTFYGVTFPAEIAGAASISVRDYEQTSPGLGYSVGYRRGDQVMTVYIYSKGQRTIPDDPQAPVVKAEFEKSKGEISGSGLYKSVDGMGDWTIEDAKGRTRFACAAYVLLRNDGPVPRDSFLCLGAVKNNFFKFRITGDQRAGSEAAASDFVRAWTKVLWP